MSGILNSGLNGSNSNLPENTGKAFSTSFFAQSGSSNAVLNQSGLSGNVQGIHNFHGSFNMPNIQGPHTSQNSANLGGLPSGAQQVPRSISNGRYSINNLPNVLSQLSLGSVHGHSGATNTGGPGVFPNMGSTGRVANSIGGLTGGGNTSRGPSSSGVANIPGLASRLNMNAPQVMSMPGNNYTVTGLPLSQNQFQSGNSDFSFMALLNDPNLDNVNFDVNEFPQLSGHPSSAGSCHGQIGLLQNHNTVFAQQNQEFSILNDDFPALSGYKGGLNIGGSSEYTVNTHPKEQIHDSMPNLLQTQQLSMGRSSGFSFGGSYSLHHAQQHRSSPSSINGTGLSYLTSGNQDFHFHVPELYQQFQQSQSRSMNPFRDKDMKSTQVIPDQYGMMGLLRVIKMFNPKMTTIAMGFDLTALGLNLNSAGKLYKTFASPWSEEPVKPEPEYKIPECYFAKQAPQLKQCHFARFRPETLFYIFYSMPKDEAQLYAANELHNRGWLYHKELHLWLIRAKNVELLKTGSYERGCFFCFDPNTWQTVRKDNFVLQYDMIEKSPILPQQQP